MHERAHQPTLSRVLVRALTVSALAIVIAGGSAAIGLTAVGWAAPLLVIVVGVSLIWFLLERAERSRRAGIRVLAERALEIGSPPLKAGIPAPDGVRRALALLDERRDDLSDIITKLETGARSARDVLDAIDEPVIATDERGRVRLCNDAALPLLASADESAAGRQLEDLLAQPELIQLHSNASAGRRDRARVRVVVDGATRWYDATAAPLRTSEAEAGRTGALLSLRDVTELATAVQLKTDFAANASHELRTPIASIRAAVETMARAGDSDTAMRERLRAMIETNVTRLEDMVGDLLDLSRLEEPGLRTTDEQVDLEQLCASLFSAYEQLGATRNLEFRAELHPAARHVRCDPKLLELIMRNLVDNATKFAFEGAPITVRARPLEAGPGEEAGAEISVIDQGIGIPLAQQQRVFERFYQVDGARQGGSEKRGTGLGLAIVKHAARRLGGSIRVESVWQEGTSMILELPGVLPSESPA